MTELLVVVAVIGLLMSIVLGVVGKAKRTAQQVKCAANLRELSVAFNNYAADHQGAFPTSGWGTDESGKPIENPQAKRWPMKISEYIGNPVFGMPGINYSDVYGNPVYGCPVTHIPGSGQGTYGLNVELIEETHPVKIFHIHNPASYPVLCCVKPSAGLRFLHAGPHPSAREFGWEGVVNSYGPAPVHPGGKCNFLFADGHVQAHTVVDPEQWPWDAPDAFKRNK